MGKTHYRWEKSNIPETKKTAKEEKMAVHCHLCDAVMVDCVGRVRTKETIWDFSIEETVLGYTHEGCAYGVEVPNSDIRDKDFGTSPETWDFESI